MVEIAGRLLVFGRVLAEIWSMTQEQIEADFLHRFGQLKKDLVNLEARLPEILARPDRADLSPKEEQEIFMSIMLTQAALVDALRDLHYADYLLRGPMLGTPLGRRMLDGFFAFRNATVEFSNILWGDAPPQPSQKRPAQKP